MCFRCLITKSFFVCKLTVCAQIMYSCVVVDREVMQIRMRLCLCELYYLIMCRHIVFKYNKST